MVAKHFRYVDIDPEIQAKTQHELLAQKTEGQDAENIELQKQLAALSQATKSTEQQLHESNNQNTLLANEKLVLAQEKAQLNGQLQQLEKMAV